MASQSCTFGAITISTERNAGLLVQAASFTPDAQGEREWNEAVRYARSLGFAPEDDPAVEWANGAVVYRLSMVPVEVVLG